MTLVQEVLALLEKLGKTAEEVAAKLVTLGIKGDREQCSACPIAEYLTSNEIDNVHVATRDAPLPAGVVTGMYCVYGLDQFPQLQGVYDFIIGFDLGKFPECERAQ